MRLSSPKRTLTNESDKNTDNRDGKKVIAEMITSLVKEKNENKDKPKK